jgi:hypothetical protein
LHSISHTLPRLVWEVLTLLPSHSLTVTAIEARIKGRSVVGDSNVVTPSIGLHVASRIALDRILTSLKIVHFKGVVQETPRKYRGCGKWGDPIRSGKAVFN